jgi:TonB family protein
LIGLAGVYFTVAPYITLSSMRSALTAGDSAALEDLVDFPRLRESLKGQINAFMLKQMASELKDNPFGGLALALAPKMVDTLVDASVTPVAIEAIARGERPNAASGSQPSQRVPFSDYRVTRETLDRFSVWVRGQDGEEMRLIFHRYALRWKLTGAIIPFGAESERQSSQRIASSSISSNRQNAQDAERRDASPAPPINEAAPKPLMNQAAPAPPLTEAAPAPPLIEAAPADRTTQLPSSSSSLPPLAGSAAPVRVGGNINPPTKIRDVRPIYPAVAQSARVQGVVIMEATIGANGKVQDARVLRSIPLLDQAALDAVRQWEFTPTVLNGVPVPVIMTVTVPFTLS